MKISVNIPKLDVLVHTDDDLPVIEYSLNGYDLFIDTSAGAQAVGQLVELAMQVVAKINEAKQKL